ncbi:putative Wee1-like protein kinase [Hypsibius exemplaris]|uniref:Wee1-like protein kinase n=1 Tax=Hypsibius exemplaris TaxID=2072580 RepID=A0A1W0XDF5_HYPEX|nr:putative Wee1-like protein kinase [Hypsibius exemplaris]
MNRIPHTPLPALRKSRHAQLDSPVLLMKQPCFDEDDDMEQDSPKADLSIMRRNFCGMGVADDSMNASFNLSIDASPGFSEESGIGHSVSSATPSPDDKFTRTHGVSSTPALSSWHAPPGSGRRSRQSIGEVPGTPIKSKRGPRISLNGGSTLARSEGVVYSIQEECNFNPFSADPLVVQDRDEHGKKRMLSTPDASRSSLTAPESGYGSHKHKTLKTEKVVFSLGTPLESLQKISLGGSGHSSPNSRYEAEFVELDVIGSGHFGRVTKVRKRLDGVTYAIKRTQESVQKTSFSDVVREVFALAALEWNPNVLRYFSSWIEGGHLYIQSEYCDAGTLGQQIEQYNKLDGKKFDEEDIRRIVRQAGNGLAFLHEQALVHLDVKPDNILISYRRRVTSGSKDGSRPGSATPDDDQGKFIYKIGDLGHVRSFRHGPVTNCMDGDRDYLAPEILHDMEGVLHDAPKADVYSLGITLFVTARVNRNPVIASNLDGIERRNGLIPGVVDLALALNQLFQSMTASDPSHRPTMYEVISSPCIHTAHKTNEELQMDLHIAHMENTALTKQLANANRVSLKGYAPAKPKILLIGRNKIRSVSTQAF